MKDAKVTYESARTLMMASVAAAVVLAVIAALLLIILACRASWAASLIYAADIARQVAEGNLTVQVELRRGDEDSLLFALKGMVDKLAQTIGEVRSAADSLSAASGTGERHFAVAGAGLVGAGRQPGGKPPRRSNRCRRRLPRTPKTPR